MRNNQATRVFISFYESILARDQSIPWANYEFMYLLYIYSCKGMYTLLLFYVTGAYKLDDRTKVQSFLNMLEEEHDPKLYDLEREDRDKVIEFLNAHKRIPIPYVEHNKVSSISKQLLEDLEKQPFVTDSGFISTTNDRINEIIKSVFNAGYYFLLEPFKYCYTLIMRAGGAVVNSRERFPVTLVQFYKFILRTWFFWSYHKIPMDDQEHLDNQRGETSKEHGSDLTHPLFNYNTAKIINRYFNRHTFRNLRNSPFFGLIQSRLYSGSWNLTTIQKQDFSMSCKDGSMCDIMKSSENGHKLSIFTGSSYACYSTVKLLGTLKPQHGRPYRVFQEGILEFS